MSGETCGCCTGIHVETPRAIANRPGLRAINYRAGDFLAFKRSMLAALNKTVLANLSRGDDDPSIALIDAWAMTADILTFYQERTANESYLRTATERRSVLELARLLGYELGPGVAASAALAFAVDDSPGAPGRLTIDAGTRVQSVPGQNESPQAFETSEPLDARAAWNELHPHTSELRAPRNGDIDVYLDGTATNLRAGDGLLFTDGTRHDFRRVAQVIPDFDAKRTQVTWVGGLFPPATGTVNLGAAITASTELLVARASINSTPLAIPSLTPLPMAVYAMRVQTPLFGANAADPRTLSKEVKSNYTNDETLKKWAFTFSEGRVDLDGPRPEVHGDSHLVLIHGNGDHALFTIDDVTQVTVANYALVGKATRLKLASTQGLSAFDGDNYRATIAFAGEDLLPLAERPLSSNVLQSPIEIDTHIDSFEAGRPVIVSGLAGSEIAFVEAVNQEDDPLHSKLVLEGGLSGSYDVRTARIFANVAMATNGESVRETLGGGDATMPFQRFRLSHAPLTYVSTDLSPRGAASTLQMFINDIRWQEVETLFGAGPRARVYIMRRDDDGRTYVQFGDGVTSGARLPTGNDNVRAFYRKGIGTGANVAAGKLTLLMSRPLGLSDVNNPIAAEGGADAEVLADARSRAPRNVLTLDRVVSLLDYQSFAAAFGGVAKALATWTMAGTRRQLFLTVAGPKGATFTSNSKTLISLAGALRRFGDPYVPLRIESYADAKFRLKANIIVDPDRVAGEVLGRVRDAVADAFSFEAKSFGEAVDLSDLVAVMQNVDGVASVDIDLLYRSIDTPARNERLSARMPKQQPDGTILAGEILTLDHADIAEAR